MLGAERVARPRWIESQHFLKPLAGMYCTKKWIKKMNSAERPSLETASALCLTKSSVFYCSFWLGISCLCTQRYFRQAEIQTSSLYLHPLLPGRAEPSRLHGIDWLIDWLINCMIPKEVNYSGIYKLGSNQLCNALFFLRTQGLDGPMLAALSHLCVWVVHLNSEFILLLCIFSKPKPKCVA